MFVFLGKLAVLLFIGALLGFIVGVISDPKIGVAAFLIFTVSFRETVMKPVNRG